MPYARCTRGRFLMVRDGAPDSASALRPWASYYRASYYFAAAPRISMGVAP
jgi:hypothetical protein